jgi:asparagine synthase (glutamine-hydrolysing)
LSGIFGVFNCDGKAVTLGDLDAMHQVFAQWFDDDRGIWCDDNVGLGHTMSWNTPESKLESLPSIDGSEGKRLLITADVRLDNRDELADALAMNQPLAAITDSQLLLAAYRKWGESSPKHLLGDFAYVIWDEQQQHLFCARDHVGIKVLYYATVGDTFVFANHISALVDTGLVTAEFNDEHVAIYLEQGYCHSREQTFYKAVTRVPPATTLRFSRHGVQLSQYWCPEDAPPTHYKTNAEYVGHLRELLIDAVSDRTRSNYPIFSHMSGGLDSSCIASIAARILAKQGGVLHAYNWNFVARNSNRDHFEWRLADELANREGIRQHAIDLSPESLAEVFSSVDVSHDDVVDLWYEFSARDFVRSKGGRVLLSGWGGDELISSHGVGYIDQLILHGHFRKAWSITQALSKPTSYSFFRFSKLCIGVLRRELTPAIIYRLLGRFKQKNALMPDYILPAGRDSGKGESGDYRQLSRASVRAYQLGLYHLGHITERTQAWYASGLERGIEYRFPLLDKRVLEFALTIPPYLFKQGGIPRYIFREALSEIVPEAIRHNREKDEPQRIRHFHQITVEALQLACNNAKPLSSPYISETILAEEIKNSQIEFPDDMEDVINRGSPLLRAYFVSRMGKSDHPVA